MKDIEAVRVLEYTRAVAQNAIEAPCETMNFSYSLGLLCLEDRKESIGIIVREHFA